MLTDEPFYSPNLNLIKQLCYKLKKLIYQVYQDLDLVTVSDGTIQEVLRKVLKEA